MILTGKAKEDFIKWYDENYISVEKFLKDFDIEELYNSLHRIMQDALIIEWFDSVGIFINIIGYTKTKWRVIVRSNYDEDFNSRQEATEEAIKKANEIYNKN